MNTGWLVAIGLALAVGGFGAGYASGSSHAETRAKLVASQRDVKAQEQTITQQREARQEEDRRNEIVEKTSEQTQQKTDAAATAVVASDAAADRLRKQLELSERKLSGSQASCDTRIAGQRSAAQAQYGVLAELYRSADEAQGRLAQEAERYRIAGEACEAQYRGVRNAGKISAN